MVLALERMWSPRRRLWIIATCLALTMTYSWNSVNRLREVAAVSGRDRGNHSLLELAEENIASQLHVFQDAVGAHRGGITGATAGARMEDAHSALPNLAAGGSAPPRASTQPSSASTSQSAGRCGKIMPHTDFWGEALVWGDKNSQPSQEACCEACRTYTPDAENEFSSCNVWVFCGDRALCGDSYGQCWLKHLAHPGASKAASEGPEVGWTTGVFHTAGGAVDPPADPTEDRSFHTVITAQGSAVHWQSRVGYYWFLKTRKACRAASKCDMGGFTRVLHSGEADDLMEEIPTYVAQPLPKEHPNHGYVVLNRPYALMQWARDVTLPEKYVLMSEPDHVWLKPMPNLMSGHHPAAFPFFYIEPSTKKNIPLVAKYVGAITKQEAEQIAPIGNAPTMMHWDDLQRAMPVWFNVSIAVHEDEETAKEWGWVQEMYAFTLSLYKVGIKRVDLFLEMMAQPPWDTELAPPYILHYTYGMDYTLEGEFTPGKYGAWRFDKRSYASLPPPRNLGEPPAGMKNELVRHLIHAINEASAAIPGWDQYAKTGQAKQLWDGKV